MKRTVAKILAALMLSGLLFIPTTTVAVASCSGWTNANNPAWTCVFRLFCDRHSDNVRTRFVQQERWCAVNGVQVRETRNVQEESGCC